MKSLPYLLFFLFWHLAVAAQDEITIKDIEIPTSPALMLLDNASSNIETPKSTKALTGAVLDGLFKNASVEFTPYFFLKETKNYYNYNNFYVSEEDNKTLKYRGVLSGNVYSNLSISMGVVRTDTTSNFAIGFKTNLVSIASSEYLKDFKKTEENYKVIYDKQKNSNPEELKNDTNYQDLLKENYKLLDSIALYKPTILLDIAGAYNHFFNSTNYSEGRSGKIGAWATASWNIRFLKMTKTTNYLSFYLYGRFLRDRMIYDASKLDYTEKDFKDIGGKVELEFKNLSFAYEYIKRDEKDNYRSVGLIKFKLKDAVLLQGGFGKNFEQAPDMLSFLGISWGIDFGNKFAATTDKEE